MEYIFIMTNLFNSVNGADSVNIAIGNVTTTVSVGNSEFLPVFQDNTANLVQSNWVTPVNFNALDTWTFYPSDPSIIDFESYLDDQSHDSKIVISWDNINQQLMLSNLPQNLSFPITSIADGGGGEVVLTTTDTSRLSPGATIIVVSGTINYNGNHLVVSKTATTINITAVFAGSETGNWGLLTDTAYITVRNRAVINGLVTILDYGQYVLSSGATNKYLSADGNIDTNFNMITDGDGYLETIFSCRFDSASRDGLAFILQSSRQNDQKLSTSETTLWYKAG